MSVCTLLHKIRHCYGCARGGCCGGGGDGIDGSDGRPANRAFRRVGCTLGTHSDMTTRTQTRVHSGPEAHHTLIIGFDACAHGNGHRRHFLDRGCFQWCELDRAGLSSTHRGWRRLGPANTCGKRSEWCLGRGFANAYCTGKFSVRAFDYVSRSQRLPTAKNERRERSRTTHVYAM